MAQKKQQTPHISYFDCVTHYKRQNELINIQRRETHKQMSLVERPLLKPDGSICVGNKETGSKTIMQIFYWKRKHWPQCAVAPVFGLEVANQLNQLEWSHAIPSSCHLLDSRPPSYLLLVLFFVKSLWLPTVSPWLLGTAFRSYLGYLTRLSVFSSLPV